MAGKNDGKIRCSFCGKTQDQVGRLISGPNGAFICDECVDICAEIIEEENFNDKGDASPKEEINLLKPEELKAFLDDYLIGDKYFKVKKDKHNLIRTRSQIALAKDMEKKMDSMQAIVNSCADKYKRV